MKALITGATSGIGKAIAQELSRRGVSLILTGRNENALLQMQETLPVHTEIIALDLAENQAPFTLYEFCKNKHVDILVNNAGLMKRVPMIEMSHTDFLRVIDVHVGGACNCSKAVLPDMIAKREGKIINICSMMSELGRETVSAYAAAKGAL